MKKEVDPLHRPVGLDGGVGRLRVACSARCWPRCGRIATRLVVFDTAVVDLTDQLDDPVDVLFGTQLGGGTDINRALAYCQSQITRPADTVVVLISDLYEGGIRDEMLEAGRGDEGVRRAVRDAARAVRRGRARPTTGSTRRRWPRWAPRRSPAPPTCSPR